MAIFDIGSEKAPGSDGCGTPFFKSYWEIVGLNVCKAIHNFFKEGRLLGEVNATTLAMVPKVPKPSSPTDIRPMSCR